MAENITPDDTLDCSGLSCPMPLLKTKKHLKNMLPSFAKKSGHELLGMKEEDGRVMFYLKIK
jgi:tRNA 2-thiouridine synthesizing protein A